MRNMENTVIHMSDNRFTFTCVSCLPFYPEDV